MGQEQTNRAIDFLWQSVVSGRQCELIRAQQEYIALLEAELNEVIPFVSVHGWRSKRVADGEALRAKIADLRYCPK